MRKLTSQIEEMMLNVLSDSTYASAYWAEARELVDAETKKGITRTAWSELRGETLEDKIIDGMRKGYLLKMIPAEDDAVFVSYAQLEAVVKKHYRALEEEEMDSDSAMQTACFGELVYG